MHARAGAAILVALATLTLPRVSVAQERRGLTVEEFQSGWSLRAEFRDEEYDASGGRSHIQEEILRENLLFQTKGYYYHPRLLEYRLKFEGGLEQAWENSSRGRGTANRNGWNIGYSAFTNWFKNLSYHGSLYSWRREEFTRQSFFETTRAQIMESGVNLFAEDWWIPSRLHYHHYSFVGKGANTTKDFRDNVLLEGARRFDVASLEYKAEHNNVRLKQSGNSFRDNFARAQVRFPFGDENREGMRISGDYRETSGSVETLRKGGDGDLLLNLGSGFESRTDARYEELRNGGATLSSTESVRGGTGIYHQLFASLTSHVRLDLQKTDFDTGSIDTVGWEGGFDYRKSTSFGGLGFGYTHTDTIQDETSSAAPISVIDESHLYTPGTPIFLGNIGILLSSIVVTDNTGLTLYSTPADYIATVQGGRTRIDIPTGSLISPSQTILIDYLFNSRPSVKFRRKEDRLKAQIDFRNRASLEVGYTDRDIQIQSGTPNEALADEYLLRSRATVYEGEHSAYAEYEVVESVLTPYVRRSAGLQSLLWLSSSTSWQNSVSAYHTRFKEGEGRDIGYIADSMLDMRLGTRTSLDFRGSWRKTRQRTDTGEGMLLESHFRHRFRFAEFEVELRWTRERFRIATDQEVFYGLIKFTRRL